MIKKTRPIRIQRKRTKGWKMPKDCVYVGRPSKWGNPYKIGDRYEGYCKCGCEDIESLTRDNVLELYEDYMYRYFPFGLQELKGKNLACWCKEGDKCHADILLKLANETSP